jgi:hypothetical protein
MPEDQRRHLRLPVESTVFIELVSAGAVSGKSGQVAICKTIDVSRGGLGVSLEYELVVGAILQIGVELPHAGDTLYLTGEVRWCRANGPPDGGWSTGFALLDAEGSDIDRWTELLRSMED